MDYASLLNPQQLAPVMDTEGAVLVLAGAGSGKTRVLTHRIAYLIEKKHVRPSSILAITFTNKAAGEMKERVMQLTGSRDVWISTFHSFCARVLRADVDAMEVYTSNFSIYDDSDCNRVLTRIFKNMEIEDGKEFKKTVRWHISNAKNMALNASGYADRIKDVPQNVLISEIYHAYEEELQRNNAMDFDDLLWQTIVLFSKRRDILAKYQEMFQYLHIDEFQDTNKIQYLLVRLLAQKHGNVFAVGDDDQSIYGWRWAEVENIRNFTRNFPGCRIYKLEQNYRSTGNILQLANRIIAHNTDRMGKTLWTKGEDGVRVVYQTNYDERAEADFVMEQIRSLMDRYGYTYSDFAILTRVNSITRPLEEKLTLYNFPYRMIGGNKFFERKEVKDFMAYLKLVANPSDDESVMRVINVPKRGIGETAIAQIAQICRENGLHLLQGMLHPERLPMSSALATKASKFGAVAAELIRSKDTMSLYDYVRHVAEVVDFAQMYDKDDPEGKERLDNIDEFLTSVREFQSDNPDAKLDEYLQSVSLVSDTDEIGQDDCITLATVHGVKGLEFRCVFVVGLEEGIFPTRKESEQDMQEERRIMYVAVTRAQERLYLTNAQSRFRYGSREFAKASRFLEEGGLVVKKRVDDADWQDHKAQTFDFASVAKKQQAASFARTTIPQQTVASRDVSIFRVGQTVRHARFGDGVIREMTGENAKIEFPVLGVKTFNMRLAPVQIVEQGENHG